MNRFFKGVEYQRGFGCNKHTSYLQEGGWGLGSIASKFFNFISPYISKVKDYALPALKSGAKEVGQELVKSASDIAKDVIRGRNVKESVQDRVSTDKLKEIALNRGDQLIDNVASAIQGGDGYKRKKDKRFSLPFKKRPKYLDIFSN